MNISYDKAYRARKLAYAIVRGRSEDFYTYMHVYSETFKIENPSIVFHIQTEDFVNLKYMFMAMEISIRGFKTLTWHVIMVYDTHLKSTNGCYW